jgi:hypothetical protein
MPDPVFCSGCAKQIPEGVEFCPTCGPPAFADSGEASAGKPAAVAAPAPAAAVPPAPAPPPPPPGRPHSPAAALVLGLVLPGAGQAYNGHPFKALFFFFASPLVLPWIWSLVDAHRWAKQLVSEGGRYGRGGWLWVLLQAWLGLNAALLVLILLTLCGVLT